MNTTNKILQWNINGYYRRKENLHRVIHDYQPLILCLQETNFKGESHANRKNFTCYFKNRMSNKASGGVAIYVKSDLPSKEIPLNTNIESIAIECYMPEKITICNIYLPNSCQINLDEL